MRIRRRCTAAWMAAVRLSTPSLSYTCARCVFTVASLMNRLWRRRPPPRIRKSALSPYLGTRSTGSVDQPFGRSRHLPAYRHRESVRDREHDGVHPVVGEHVLVEPRDRVVEFALRVEDAALPQHV